MTPGSLDVESLPALMRSEAALYRALAIVKLAIARKAQAPSAPEEPDRLLSAAEAAPMLGTTEDHVWSMMRRGKLPCVVVGKKYKKVPLSAIQAMMHGQPIPAPAAPRLRTPRISRKTA
jgi:predicted DNA-binding transcriptional regulator AlpA